MAPRTDRTTPIQSGVASPVTTNHAAKGSVFFNLRNAGNLKNDCDLKRFWGQVSKLERKKFLMRPILLLNPVLEAVHAASNDIRKVHRNVQRFRGGLVFQAHRLCVSLNSRRARNNEEKKTVLEAVHAASNDVRKALTTYWSESTLSS